MSDGNILDQMIENQENGIDHEDDTKDGVALLNNQVWGTVCVLPPSCVIVL